MADTNIIDIEELEEETGTKCDNLVFMMVEMLESPEFYGRKDILKIAEFMATDLQCAKFIHKKPVNDSQLSEFLTQIKSFRASLNKIETFEQEQKRDESN